MKKSLSFVPAGLLLLALLAPLSASSQAPNPFLGDWKGKISIPDAGVELGIAVHFSMNDKKELTGTLDSLDQGAMGLPLGSIKTEGRNIEFKIEGVPGDPLFKGALDETGKIFSGTFSQNNYEGTFKTEKAAK